MINRLSAVLSGVLLMFVLAGSAGAVPTAPQSQGLSGAKRTDTTDTWLPRSRKAGLWRTGIIMWEGGADESALGAGEATAGGGAGVAALFVAAVISVQSSSADGGEFAVTKWY